MPPLQSAAAPVRRIIFLTRDPVVHEQSGSTSYIAGLLQLLRGQGAQVTLVATTAYSRSPRLFFRNVAGAPAGVKLCFPGYLRIGNLYLRPLAPKAWARALVRLAVRRPGLRLAGGWLTRLYGTALYPEAWDLTEPTAREKEQAVQAILAADATAVIANYCIWGALLADSRVRDRSRTAILMHDLLSARAARFAQSGTPLDMPPLSEAEEMQRLGRAQTVLAAQEREADVVRAHIASTVLVTPVVLQPRALHPAAMVPGRCLFVGSNIAPNRSGVAFLLESVWPLVRAEVPGATLAIAGTVGLALAAEERPASLPSLGVEVLGKVPTLENEYARAAVCVVPLLLGTGIKIKLLEALSFGKAVVSTPVGIEGLEAWTPEAVCVAEDAGAFAKAMVQLLMDERLRRSREAAALQLAREHFGPDRELDPAFAKALL